jgi:glycosyltransferase involved in cell wall biosynthesis
MGNAPRVSVVIPAWENAPFIAATMRSVLAQTFTDFELVVADHGSADRTWEILQGFAHDERVRLLRTPPGGGAERNWNRVTRAARGELVKLVCGDDLLAPQCLATQVAAYDAHRGGPHGSGDATGAEVVMVASARDVIDASGRAVVRRHGLRGLTGRVPGHEAIRRSVVRGTNIFGEPCCVLVRRSVLEDVGGWHGNPGFMIDQATYCRVLLRGDLVVAPGSLAAFRLSSTQLSVSLAADQARSAVELHRQVAELLPGLTPGEVRLGNARARLRAFQRRLVYRYLGRRMRPVVRQDEVTSV